MKIIQFTFNPFSENTFLLYDETSQCAIIDPGMTDEEEDSVLFDAIEAQGLKPASILNTHCHLDHILGNASCASRYNIPLYAHRDALSSMDIAPAASLMWGVPYRESPRPTKFLQEGEKIHFGNTTLDILFTPGHAPGHVVFVNHAKRCVIGGDVLFRGSVGRVDLPGSVASDLVCSIREKLYTLPEDYVVYPGHGPETTIGEEKRSNAFVRPEWSAL